MLQSNLVLRHHAGKLPNGRAYDDGPDRPSQDQLHHHTADAVHVIALPPALL